MGPITLGRRPPVPANHASMIPGVTAMSTSTFDNGVVSCPGCQIDLVAPFAAAGKAVRCKCCGTGFRLPPATDLFDTAVAFMLEQEAADHDDDGDVVQQIQHDTMVRDEPVANQDVAWLG